MKIGSKLQFEVPDKCPALCSMKSESFYQGNDCSRCPVFNCGKVSDFDGEFSLMKPEEYRDDCAKEWELFFKTGKEPKLNFFQKPIQKPELKPTEKRDTWDDYFMNLCEFIASRSKDRSTKVGCVVVGNRRNILATGYNGFPRGVDDNVDNRHTRPDKYNWTEHAERNAIYNAAAEGVKLQGSTIYVPWFPCHDCARAIIQAGIARVVVPEYDIQDEIFGKSWKIAEQMFLEANVEVIIYPYQTYITKRTKEERMSS